MTKDSLEDGGEARNYKIFDKTWRSCDIQENYTYRNPHCTTERNGIENNSKIKYNEVK